MLIAAILLGAPGSGKGTQTELLCDRLGFSRVSTGDIIRAEVKAESSFGLAVKEYQENGELVPDSLVCSMVGNRIRKGISKPGIVFDGFPRTRFQAEELDRYLNELSGAQQIIINILVPFDEIIDRILSRIGCQQCGKVYSSRVDNLAEGEACPACGATLVARSDDSRDVLKVRYDIFQRELNPILEYYEDRVINIDGRRPAEDVFLEVVKQIRIQNVESFNA